MKHFMFLIWFLVTSPSCLESACTYTSSAQQLFSLLLMHEIKKMLILATRITRKTIIISREQSWSESMTYSRETWSSFLFMILNRIITMFEHANTRKHVFKHSCSSVQVFLSILAYSAHLAVFFSDFIWDR